jgi:hypothetical protein
MSDVRRVGVEEQDDGVYEVWVDPIGTHYLVPRGEYERWQRSRVKYAVGEENELLREQITQMQAWIERLGKELEETKRYWEECQVEHHKRNLECQRLRKREQFTLDAIEDVAGGDVLRWVQNDVARRELRIKDSDLLAERRAEEILNYQADIERLRKVVDAVKRWEKALILFDDPEKSDWRPLAKAEQDMAAALRELEDSDV